MKREHRIILPPNNVVPLKPSASAMAIAQLVAGKFRKSQSNRILCNNAQGEVGWRGVRGWKVVISRPKWCCLTKVYKFRNIATGIEPIRNISFIWKAG